MDAISTLTSKGQTTVPRKIRELLGLGPRQRIIYEIDAGSVRIRAAADALSASAGVLADDKPALGLKEERKAYRKARSGRYVNR